MELTLWLWGIGGKKVCAPERGKIFLEMAIFKTFSCVKFDVVVVNKRLLGHHQKFQKVHKIPLPPVQIQQNSLELILIC